MNSRCINIEFPLLTSLFLFFPDFSLFSVVTFKNEECTSELTGGSGYEVYLFTILCKCIYSYKHLTCSTLVRNIIYEWIEIVLVKALNTSIIGLSALLSFFVTGRLGQEHVKHRQNVVIWKAWNQATAQQGKYIFLFKNLYTRHHSSSTLLNIIKQKIYCDSDLGYVA